MMPSLTPRQREMFTRVFACRALTVAELARDMGMSPVTASREVLYLERHTLVVSELHPTRSARKQRLSRVVRPAPWTVAA